MRIVVCVKQVPDTETRIKIAPSGDAIVEGDVNWIVSPYDEFAIEEALRLREAQGGDVVLVTVGPDRAQSALRNGLAMGADSADSRQGFRPRRGGYGGNGQGPCCGYQELGPLDLILTGQQGVGGDNSQVPGLLAEALDLPQVTVAVKIEIGPGKRPSTREVEGARETWETSLPGRDIGPEGTERAPLRQPEGNHGGEEEADQAMDAAALGLAAAALAPRTRDRGAGAAAPAGRRSA